LCKKKLISGDCFKELGNPLKRDRFFLFLLHARKFADSAVVNTTSNPKLIGEEQFDAVMKKC